MSVGAPVLEVALALGLEPDCSPARYRRTASGVSSRRKSLSVWARTTPSRRHSFRARAMVAIRAGSTSGSVVYVLMSRLLIRQQIPDADGSERAAPPCGCCVWRTFLRPFGCPEAVMIGRIGRMRWNAGYVPDDDSDPEVAGVEAATSIEAVARLREVVGTDTDVLYVIPDAASTEYDDDATYEAFLRSPNTAS